MKSSARAGDSVTSVILGSSSPQRLSLLSLILPPRAITVLAPQCPEVDFEEAREWDEIERRLQINAREKASAVRSRSEARSGALILSADTMIVGCNEDRSLQCLGKPPSSEWAPVVRSWFQDYYFPRLHYAATAVVVEGATCRREFVVRTAIRFRSAPDLVDWYLETGEPQGKAGGYAIQGAGSVFLDRLEGSLSNVIGLPLEATLEVLIETGVISAAKQTDNDGRP